MSDIAWRFESGSSLPRVCPDLRNTSVFAARELVSTNIA